MVVAFHAHRVDILYLMPFRFHPTTPMARYRPFLKDGKAPLASVLSRTQAFFLRIFQDDMDGFSIRKAEAGAWPWRTV